MMQQEKVTPQEVQMIRRAAGLGGIIINWDIDYSVGAGIVGPQEKCLWSKDGRRISCASIPGGGFMISQSKEPDPEYATLDRRFSSSNDEKATEKEGRSPRA